MKKYLIGDMNITDWEGIKDVARGLLDTDIENTRTLPEDEARSAAAVFTEDKKLISQMQENEKNLEIMKSFFEDEHILFGIYEDDRLVFLHGRFPPLPGWGNYGDDYWDVDFEEGDALPPWAKFMLPDQKAPAK